ncbi:MAG TPA: toxin-antitoxin system protein [Candidatus Limisoma gallistercoris]|nr:toxin-antitoxin system protein [Candidatus Limisoma gallistercoris]
MNTANTVTHQKKAAMFRLDIDLLDRLKELAKNEHRSLNNYVECVLLDVAYRKPNAETIAAIKEARSGALRDTPPIDTSNVDAMLKSMGI